MKKQMPIGEQRHQRPRRRHQPAKQQFPPSPTGMVAPIGNQHFAEWATKGNNPAVVVSCENDAAYGHDCKMDIIDGEKHHSASAWFAGCGDSEDSSGHAHPGQVRSTFPTTPQQLESAQAWSAQYSKSTHDVCHLGDSGPYTLMMLDQLGMTIPANSQHDITGFMAERNNALGLNRCGNEGPQPSGLCPDAGDAHYGLTRDQVNAWYANGGTAQREEGGEIRLCAPDNGIVQCGIPVPLL